MKNIFQKTLLIICFACVACQEKTDALEEAKGVPNDRILTVLEILPGEQGEFDASLVVGWAGFWCSPVLQDGSVKMYHFGVPASSIESGHVMAKDWSWVLGQVDQQEGNVFVLENNSEEAVEITVFSGRVDFDF